MHPLLRLLRIYALLSLLLRLHAMSWLLLHALQWLLLLLRKLHLLALIGQYLTMRLLIELLHFKLRLW